MTNTPSCTNRNLYPVVRRQGASTGCEAGSLPTLATIWSSLREMRTLLEATDHAMAEYIQMRQMASVQHLARELGHDFRNALLAVGGLVMQLEKTLPHAEVKSKADAIRSVLRNLEALVAHLQSIGADEGADEALLEHDLSEEVCRVAEMIRHSLGSSICLRVQVLTRCLPVLLARGDLWRILSNLLLNARDAMPGGGEVHVETSAREVDRSYCQAHGNARPGLFAVIAVSDQGVGIPTEVLPRIFDPLFSTKPAAGDGQRRGWGLAIVYTLVRRRGGWIDVDSRIGQGTDFEVFLPLCDERPDKDCW